MVFTLTAAMLVGTPLTASAAGLADLYQIEDGWGNVIGNEDNTSTGTVTVTQTYSATLEANNEPVGIYLDDSNVELVHPADGTLTAAIDWGEGVTLSDEDKKLNDEMLKNLTWKSSDTAVVALDGKFNGGPRNVIKLHPKNPGTATVTVSLNSKDGKYNFSASATVTVIRYADELKFKEKEIEQEALTGNSINLNDYVDRYLDGQKVDYTSDKLTFSLKLDEKNTNKNAATLKNDVLSFKKAGNIRILAVGQKPGAKVGTGWKDLAITAGNNAKKIEFSGTDVSKNKLAFKINKGMDWTVTATVTQKNESGRLCTDKISWSSKKPAIVEVADTAPMKLNSSDACSVKLIAKAPGKAQIVAKASGGKSATLTVTVSADLTKIKIEEAPKKLYSGQTIDLYDLADQYFEDKGDMNFTDAGLKWMFENNDKDMKSAASINSKGVLSVKADLSKAKTKTIKVLAVNAKKVGTKKSGEIASNVISIDLEQVNVTSITVLKGKTPIAMVTSAKDSGKPKQDSKIKNKTDNIAIDSSEDYNLVAKGYIEGGTEEVELDSAVLGWSASGNGKIVKASKNPSNNGVLKAVKKGKATITINSATKKVKGNKTSYVAIKTTFKANVTVPTKTLTLSMNNKGIAATGKNQNITIRPVMEKGTTTKNKKNGDLIWSAVMSNSKTVPIDKDTGKISKFNVGDSDVGATLTVTARVKNGGPTATITLPIVKKSSKLVLTPKGTIKIENGQPITIGAKVNDVTPGTEGVSTVTYTVNKAGIVRIRDLGNGQIEVNPVTNGTVKITATTLDGKKTSCTVKVSKVTFANDFWAPKQ